MKSNNDAGKISGESGGRDGKSTITKVEKKMSRVDGKDVWNTDRKFKTNVIGVVGEGDQKGRG